MTGNGARSEPRITALLPLRDYHRPYLDRALESLFAQTSPRWRLLVITTQEQMGELSRVLAEPLGDPRVRLIPREAPKLAGALNTGMREATTDFVAILLGDDMWAPQAVEVLTDAIERWPDVDFFHSSRVIVDEHDRPISTIREARDGFTFDDFIHGSPVKHLLCWRRERGLAIGGIDETIESVGPDDYDFPWSMWEAGARFRAVPDILYFHRDHRDCYRLTTHLTMRTHMDAIRRILDKHGVDPARADAAIADAKDGYLRQCIYRSRLDRFVKQLLRYDAKRGRRLTYR